MGTLRSQCGYVVADDDALFDRRSKLKHAKSFTEQKCNFIQLRNNEVNNDFYSTCLLFSLSELQSLLFLPDFLLPNTILNKICATNTQPKPIINSPMVKNAITSIDSNCNKFKSRSD